MPGHWKLGKKWNSQKDNIHRSKSEKEVPYQLQKRRRTASATMEGKARRCQSVTMLNSTKDSPEHLYATGRHYKRRHALLVGSDQNLHLESADNGQEISINFLTICLEDGNASFKRTVAIDNERTLEDLLLSTFHQQGIYEENLGEYHITSCRGGVYSSVDIKAPASEYLASVIEIQPLGSIIEKNNTSAPGDELSIKSCLRYFEVNGLVEIPATSTQVEEEDMFHLPRVPPLDPIESSWEDLDIYTHIKKSLSPKELAQQQAIWELIATEHSFLRQLETVINLFMRALELIRRTGLLTEVNYHNVFGYMEEIYLAHEQFWSWTLYPCLEKVRTESCPLDLQEILIRFPTEFSTDYEIYEQHCAFESTNLRSLDEAMNQTDFRTYLEWCESQPQCERLKLKDFLAKPMQRLTKYSLLFKAILGKTTNETQVEDLEQLIGQISKFVTSVNGVLRAQEETALVEKTMKKIVGYNPFEIPSDFKELVQPYVHLDLLAPMPDVDITRPRILIVEGKLRYRDNHTRMVAHVFLFSDMLLITKPRGTDRYIVARPPFKINQLQVYHKESGNILCLVLNEFGVLSDIFTLKAHSYDAARDWMDNITAAQDFYSSALKHKTQSWHILESLRSKRVIDGISQDPTVSDNQLSNGDHRWSIQSVSGSPVFPRFGNSLDFTRVPSGDSTFSASSWVFPNESQNPQTERRNTMPARSTSLSRPSMLEIGSFSNIRTSLSPSPDSQLLMTPQNSPAASPATQRPSWQRAHSLTTLFSHHGEHSLSEHTRTKKNVQLTLQDATTQTESDYLFDKISSLDEDTTDEGDSTPPLLRSPAIPISITVSPMGGTPTVKHHHRSKSDCLPSAQYKASSEESDFSPSQDGRFQNEFLTSPRHAKEKNLKRIACIDEWDDTTTVTEKSSDCDDRDIYETLSITLPSNFRFPSNDSRIKLHRHSASVLSKIHESTDEESDENEDVNRHTSFSRDSKLRRSKSSFELSYGSRSLLKPPSPLTTHMHRSRERLNAITSPVLKSRSQYAISPTLPIRELMFMGNSLEEEQEEQEEDDDDDDSEWQKKAGTGQEKHMKREPLSKKQHSLKERAKRKSPEQKLKEEKQRWWPNKNRVKSAGTNRGRRSLFGLFKGRAMSVESGINHIPPRPLNFNSDSLKFQSEEKLETISPKTSKKSTLGPRSPRKSPTKSSKKQSSKAQDKSPKRSPIKSSASKNHSSPVFSRAQKQLVNASKQSQRNVRMLSLKPTQPDYRVVFLSNVGRSNSLPSSPAQTVRHRTMQVVPFDDNNLIGVQ